MLANQQKIWSLKILIHLLALGLIINIYYLAIVDQLGSDPVEAVIHFTGIGGLNLLLLTLLVSPVAKKWRLGWLLQVRRLLGLYCFSYAALHLFTYIAFDLQWDFNTLLDDIIKRPYITIGMTALILLLALAVTSPNSIRRTMGRRWQSLHYCIYPVAILVPWHFYWSVKSDIREPLIYFALALTLLWLRRKRV